MSVLLSYPQRRVVQIVDGAPLFNCTLKEAVILHSFCSDLEKVVDDGTSGNPDAIATWNGYSASGNVTGQLVYANYGTIEDFEKIANVNLTGTIVIVRYGKIFRGNKAAIAASR